MTTVLLHEQSSSSLLMTRVCLESWRVKGTLNKVELNCEFGLRCTETPSSETLETRFCSNTLLLDQRTLHTFLLTRFVRAVYTEVKSPNTYLYLLNCCFPYYLFPPLLLYLLYEWGVTLSTHYIRGYKIAWQKVNNILQDICYYLYVNSHVG